MLRKGLTGRTLCCRHAERQKARNIHNTLTFIICSEDISDLARLGLHRAGPERYTRLSTADSESLSTNMAALPVLRWALAACCTLSLVSMIQARRHTEQ